MAGDCVNNPLVKSTDVEFEMTNQSITKFEVNYNGIAFLLDVAEGKMMSLNAIYVAAGSPANKDPRQWARLPATQQLVDSVAENLNVGKSHIWKSKRGQHGGGTWAHWKIATRYAAYLDTAIEHAILDVFQERIQEEIDPSKAVDRGISGFRKQGRSEEWIDSRVRTISGWKALTDVLKDHDVQKHGYAKVADSINVPIIGKTAKEFKKENGLKRYERTRNEFDDVQLNMIALSQSLSKRSIVDKDIRGNKDCARLCFDISTRVAALGS